MITRLRAAIPCSARNPITLCQYCPQPVTRSRERARTTGRRDTARTSPPTPLPARYGGVDEQDRTARPAIGVDVKDLDTFGLDNKGNYSCPIDPQSAAWNRGGTVPGEPGLALIVASAQGVFKRLSEVKPGDPIYISLAGGTRLTFKAVDATTQNSDVELQLAGCGGTGRAVYAELAPR